MAHAFDPADRFTAETFMAWLEAQPDRPRYELLDGQVYEMAAERLVHARVKARVYSAFANQIARRRLNCEALPDGVAVRIDDATTFEPDCLVRCGPRLPPETLLLTDPVIVVEVASPSTQGVDALVKLSRYFHNPSIVHYLIVLPTKRVVLHHERALDGRIVTSSHEGGTLRLDPPGLDLDIADLFTEDGLAG